MDLVIEGRFLIDGELKETSVGIEDGKIATIGKIVRDGDERLVFNSGITQRLKILTLRRIADM